MSTQIVWKLLGLSIILTSAQAFGPFGFGDPFGSGFGHDPFGFGRAFHRPRMPNHAQQRDSITDRGSWYSLVVQPTPYTLDWTVVKDGNNLIVREATRFNRRGFERTYEMGQDIDVSDISAQVLDNRGLLVRIPKSGFKDASQQAPHHGQPQEQRQTDAGNRMPEKPSQHHSQRQTQQQPAGRYQQVDSTLRRDTASARNANTQTGAEDRAQAQQQSSSTTMPAQTKNASSLPPSSRMPSSPSTTSKPTKQDISNQTPVDDELASVSIIEEDVDIETPVVKSASASSGYLNIYTGRLQDY